MDHPDHRIHGAVDDESATHTFCGVVLADLRQWFHAEYPANVTCHDCRVILGLDQPWPTPISADDELRRRWAIEQALRFFDGENAHTSHVTGTADIFIAYVLDTKEPS